MGASLTGAGLILAVYSLILPRSQRILQQRAEKLVNGIEELRKRTKDLSTVTSTKEIEEMQTQIKELAEKINLPEYLGIGVGLTFLAFIVSLFMSIWWNIGWNFEYMDKNLPTAFGGAVFLFFLVGMTTVKDIYSSLKQEYQEQKRFVNDLKKQRKLYV